MNFKRLRGKKVDVAGSLAVNDIKALYPALFDTDGAEDVSITFPAEVSVSITSNDEVDTDYRTLAANTEFTMSGVNFTNIKIKSATAQTGYIYTAQAVYT